MVRPNRVRIIPRMDIKGPNLVKGVHMEGLRIMGEPDEFVRYYYEDGADEIIYIDTVASLYGRNHLTEIVKKAASETFIPLTVGGGIRSVEDIQTLLDCGADKVAINTAAIKDPSVIRAAVKQFGSQCIVVSIQAQKRGPNEYECLTDNARERTEIRVEDWVKQVAEMGAGEILLTSVDRDGTATGFDEDLIRLVAPLASMPLIISGGAGSPKQVRDILEIEGINAVAIASMFHYHHQILEENKHVLRDTLTPSSPSELKAYLVS